MQITRAVPLKKKEVDDVLGGEDAWKNVQKTNGEFSPYSKVLVTAVSITRPAHSPGLTLACLCPTSVFLGMHAENDSVAQCSAMPKVRPHSSILHGSADAVCRRACHAVLQVREVRAQLA